MSFLLVDLISSPLRCFLFLLFLLKESVINYLFRETCINEVLLYSTENYIQILW